MKYILLMFRMATCTLFEHPKFILKINNGHVSRLYGAVKANFITDCKEIVAENKIQIGFIYAVNGKFGTLSLKASREMPGPVLQQLRNIWNLYK